MSPTSEQRGSADNSANRLALPAPAKLNLFLHVTGRRADGYHLLQTLFQFVDYCDELMFEADDTGQLLLSRPLPDVPPAQDLVIRAATLLQQQTGSRQGVTVQVNKRLPSGAGLGGGSSDVSTTLVALNHLWGLGLSVDTLAEIGLSLGADVPVFVRGEACFAEGVGELMTPVSLPEPWFLVLKPAVGIATASIFQHPELTRDCTKIKIRDFLARGAENVCEPLARKLYPEVDELLDWLAAALSKHRVEYLAEQKSAQQGGQTGSTPGNGFYRPMLTGTGSCIFAALENPQVGTSILSQLPQGVGGFVAKGCNQSPLYTALAARGIKSF